MQVNGYPDFLEIVLFPTETELLRGILHEVERTYATPFDQLESKIRNVWFSGEGFRTAEMNEEERAEWNESLQEFRGQNRVVCKKWVDFLAQGGDPVFWRIEKEETETLMMVLNDYRLYQAARHQIGEKEMDRDFASVESPTQRMALLEIHFLAWLLEMVLQALERNRES